MHLLGFIVLACFRASIQLPASLFEKSGNDEDSRIYGGRFALPGEFPWMVFLEIDEPDDMVSNCGGFIISKSYVLTAAHCVCRNSSQKIYVKPNEIVGRIGNITEEKGIEVKFAEVHIHSDYDDDSVSSDIAVLKFRNPLKEFNEYIQSICIAGENKILPSKRAVIQMGWGRFDEGDIITSPTLKTSSAGYLLNNQSCKTEMKKYVKPGELCVSNARGEKICKGDSGGPLVITFQNKDWSPIAVGIVSYDEYDKCVWGNDRPGTYTDIRYFARWIIAKTGNDSGICWRNER